MVCNSIDKYYLKSNLAFLIYSILITNYFIPSFIPDFIEQLELIQAKVPILKFRDAMQNLEVDLNCNNAVGIRNTHLLYCYSRRKFS